MSRNDAGRQRPIPWRNRFEGDEDNPPPPPRFLSDSARRTPGLGPSLYQLTRDNDDDEERDR